MREPKEIMQKKTKIHTYYNILWECSPMVNHSPGNNQGESVSLFLICCQWTPCNTQCGGKKTRWAAHGCVGFVRIEGALMHGPGQSDKRGESWLGWLKCPCWHPRWNPWGEKRKILDWSKGLSPLSLTHCLLIACPFLWTLNASKPAPLRTRTHYKRRISLGVKTITPFWSHLFRVYWGPNNFSTLAFKCAHPSPSTELWDYTVPQQLDLHSTIWPQGTSSSVSLLTWFHLARSHLCPPCLKLHHQCCYRKREQLLNRLGSPLKWL